jgi:hypothetical protein
MAATGSAPPAPTKSGGNGCLKAFIVVALIFTALGIGLFALLVFAIDRGTSKLDDVAKGIDSQSQVAQETGIVTNPLGFDKKHPPQLDVYKRPLSCSTDSSTGEAVAAGSVKNNSSHASSYLIAVEFRRDDTSVGVGVTDVYRVQPGEAMNWKAESVVDDSSSGTLTCVVTGIYRSDNPNIVPSTTETTAN